MKKQIIAFAAISFLFLIASANKQVTYSLVGSLLTDGKAVNAKEFFQKNKSSFFLDDYDTTNHSHNNPLFGKVVLEKCVNQAVKKHEVGIYKILTNDYGVMASNLTGFSDEAMTPDEIVARIAVLPTSPNQYFPNSIFIGFYDKCVISVFWKNGKWLIFCDKADNYIAIGMHVAKAH